jgi:two-component system sensor histidine kinase RegB
LAATELALTREQHLSQLDGLAAAAAHELATPLSTISVIARELERALPSDSPHGDDVRLLREQATRCRDIISKLAELPASGQPFDRISLTALIEEVVAPHRDFGITIDVLAPAARNDEPNAVRNPAIVYGLGNIVDNAVDFARSRVQIEAAWNAERVSVTVSDDGPGFAADLLQHIGEPYVTSRRNMTASGEGEGSGLGLGLFIAKTLLERSGATLTFGNRRSGGARVHVEWLQRDFQRDAVPA